MASERPVREGSSGRDDDRLRLLIDGTREYAIFALDPDGTVASWNAGAERMQGYPAGEIVGKHFSVLYPPEAIADRRPHEVLALAAVEGCREEEEWRVRQDGSRFRAHVVINALRGQSGVLIGFGVVARDITAHKDFEAQLTHQAFHDPLTGLPNRILLGDHLRMAVCRAQRSRSYVAVLFIDLDRFKEVNDSMGHRAGDNVLIDVASRIRQVLRGSDTAARFGGDEFVIVCEDLASPQEATVVAERVGRALAIAVDGGRIQVTASIGIATGNVDGDPDRLLAEADAAMYLAKDNGGHSYAVAGQSSKALSILSSPDL